MIRSLRLYVPALVREWWTLVGLVSGAVGYVVSIVAKLSVPATFWVIVFVAGIVVAQFRIYHRLRLVASPDDGGSRLPQWAGFATHANSDGAWLTVILSGPPASEGWVTSTFGHLKSVVATRFALPATELRGRSYGSGAELTWPAAETTPRFRCQVGVEGLGAVVLQWRSSDDPIPLRWLITTLRNTLEFVADGGIDEIVRPGKGRSAIVALGNWPAGGLATENVLSAERTDQFVGGYKVTRHYALSSKLQSWQIVLDFVGAALGDSGYVGFEQELRTLRPSDFGPSQTGGGQVPVSAAGGMLAEGRGQVPLG